MKQRQYNLDKTAYDLEKENKRFIWKFFTYLYFLLFSLRNFKEIYIMCGIIGFTGNLQAPGILVDGLQQLEYRGYDSAGIAVNNGSETKIVKTTGKVATLREKVEATADLAGTCGIGHTRWATHGGVTEVNAHPHVSGNVTLIHNGITPGIPWCGIVTFPHPVLSARVHLPGRRAPLPANRQLPRCRKRSRSPRSRALIL